MSNIRAKIDDNLGALRVNAPHLSNLGIALLLARLVDA
jgi:hypothetical protein